MAFGTVKINKLIKRLAGRQVNRLLEKEHADRTKSTRSSPLLRQKHSTIKLSIIMDHNASRLTSSNNGHKYSVLKKYKLPWPQLMILQLRVIATFMLD